MFLGRNRVLNQGGELGSTDAGENTEFLNQVNRPMPNGMQRFLAKKGISSYDDFSNRVQYAPRMPFRRVR
ncbi:hypothetical protein Desaci_2375 [Desulfosporosinus acidiphilus SJ4]|uniref:Uncharacterized protein n=1 Tax=Desulfosporosinus acidiphilus (strain DSM 22704 / JCM 16185 / SJ4) TaxID=646529 RepID=I4D6A4_DESAJ|nr:hypothetical protein [Desulfosporosinus acidiphilus]AFM41328.1 hypothetical protein Desaci_2375 [Desulfosporosinus acidiphilus SJ4]